MKFLFVAPRFHSNQSDMVKKLKEEGHEVWFLVMGKSQSEDYSVIEPIVIASSILNKINFSHHKYKSINYAKWASSKIPSIRKTISLLKNLNPDVIIFRGATSPMYSKIILPIVFFKKIKIVFYTQGAVYVKEISTLKRLYYKMIKSLNIKWYTTVLYRNKFNEDLLKVQNLDFIPFFMYPKTEQVKKTDSVINFLCIGKYQPNKNIKLLLEVANHLHKQKINFKITIIGSTGLQRRENYYNDVQRYIKGNKLQDKVVCLKNIDFLNIPSYYSTHHVFVLPSKKEPASISQIEAMSYGMPVICSDDNGTAHYVKNNVNGFIINTNFKTLLDAMLVYIKSPAIIQQHSEQSLNLINTEISIDNAYKKFINLINS